MKDNIVFYPITPYHLLVSIVIRRKFDATSNFLVLDARLFERSVIEKINFLGIWSNIYIIEDSSLFKRAMSIISTGLSLLKYAGAAIVYFSGGNNLCNFFINRLSVRNEIVMGEDGIGPYYLKDFKNDYTKGIPRKKEISNLILRNIMKISSGLFVCDPNLISKLILLNMKISQIQIFNTELVALKLTREDKINALDEGVNYYDHLIPTLDCQYDLVFFYSDNLEQNKRNIDYLKKTHSDSKIFHKIRVLRKNNSIETHALDDCLNFEERNFGAPWELLYHKNRERFVGADFMSEHITTSFLDTFEISDEIPRRGLLAAGNIGEYEDSALNEIMRVIERKYPPLSV